MRWYAELPHVRIRQVLADLALAVWVWLWWRIASGFRDLVAALAEPGRQLARGGDRFADGLGNVAERVGDVPLAGSSLRAPFEALASAATGIRDAGIAQQQLVHELASWSFWLLLLLPALGLGLPYVFLRLRRGREAADAAALRDSGQLHVLAVRAAAHRSLRSIRRVSRTPGEDLLTGRGEALAALELRELGLRPAGDRSA